MKILIVGESWTTHSIHVKGFDTMYTSVYKRGQHALQVALEQHGHEIEHMPSELVGSEFPFTREGLEGYDVILLSDVGSNSFHLAPQTFSESKRVPDRLALLADWVADGGGLIMVGGYLSFAGIDGKARYHNTPIAPILPVTMTPYDDRAERPAGVIGEIIDTAHPLAEGIEGEWPFLLGFNETTARPDATVVATVEGAPLIAGKTHGQGRTVVFTSDCSPHWAPPEFLAWDHYGRLWDNLARWAASKA